MAIETVDGHETGTVTRAGIFVLALGAFAASCMVALFGVVASALRCDDACAVNTGDWTDTPDAWQWGALSAISIGLFIAAFVVFVATLQGSRPALVTALGGLAVEVGLLAAGWSIVRPELSSDGSETGPFVLLAAAIVVGGAGAMALSKRS